MTSSSSVETWLRSHGVYFYFPGKKIDEGYDQYTTMMIVEGLRELGYPCFSNVAHPGLEQRAINSTQGDLVVLDVTEANYSEVLMNAFAEFQCRAKLLHSRADPNNGILTPDNVTALMTHENRFAPFRQKRLPWAFGLSNSRKASIVNEVPLSSRRRVIARNFRASMSQGVRNVLDIALLPLLEKHFEIDRCIDPSGYAQRLAGSVGCLAYGGEFYRDLTTNPSFAGNPGLARLSENCKIQRDAIVVRWDSWRFWESLAAGCLTFQLDFERYGLLLPVMPQPWKHYIPIDLSDLKGTVEQLMDRQGEWPAIAEAGKQWVLDHYISLPTARRFIQICVDELSVGNPRG